jgi:hypothetical protein
MAARDRHSVRAVATAQGARERYTGATRDARNEAISRRQPLIRKGQPTEPIVHMRVDTGLVEDQVLPSVSR